MAVTKYEDGILTFICDVCNREDTEDLTELEIKYNEEFQEYFPVLLDCSHCEKEGKYISMFVNANIPELDEMELEEMELLLPESECLSRREIRKLMWDKRPDLADKCMIESSKEYCEKHSEQLKITRRNIESKKAPQTIKQEVKSTPPFSIG